MRASQEKLSHASLEHAAQWYVRLLEEGDQGSVREQWQSWFDQHAEHQAAWRYMERVGERFAPLRSEGERAGRALRERAPARLSRRQTVKSLLLLAVGSMAGLGGWQAASRNGWTADLHTATGENREVALADGSTLWLGARTAVDTRFDHRERLLDLHFGEMLLQSTIKEPRPLRVETAAGVLQIAATPLRMGLRFADGNARLNVYQGQVELFSRNGAQALIEAGQRVDFSALAISAAAPAQASGESWVRNRLSAEAMPLQDLVDTLGRYRSGHLGLHPDVARLAVMGTFPLDDTDHALRLLEAALPVRIKRLTDWWVTVEPA
ncbi:FecR domain-containing protein [Pseudomonas sp. 148P]|uniref:FecR domain-containing protein n=1 Tax=Pseudomonas ulcerans TaxID=3115852 RepID=A0ABU7HKE2_9PSED|nr:MULTISPECIES: FecR domain-containing protein [unclassified Pseudomonas]MEE1922345.1 FecR domain-containing protein [Pseudomonas sp. 147P]MEE1931990.1 FecR domain-containing protein [Pseudomonas sp. 148P]